MKPHAGERMTSEKQAAANRRNATRSTGPVSLEGKAVSALNATRHGILAQTSILVSRGESAEDFEELRTVLHWDLQPEGRVEELLVDRLVSLVWRLRRLHAAEVGIFDEALEHLELVDGRRLSSQGKPTDHAEAAAAGWAFSAHGTQGSLAVLSRYEGTIERGLFQTLHELQRLQATRAGAGNPPPLALDVGGLG